MLRREQRLGDRLPLRRRQHVADLRRGPEHQRAIQQRLVLDLALGVGAQQLEILLNGWIGGIAVRRRPNCDDGQRRAEIARIRRLPRLVVKVEPRPGARQLARPHLQRPHAAEGGARVVTQTSAERVAVGQNQGVENRFGAA